MFATMEHKRCRESTTKSRKRFKRTASKYVETNKEFLQISGEGISDTSSESSTELCDNMSFVSGLKVGANEQRKCLKSQAEITKYLAIDCEMVGVGKQRSSALARCSVVNYNGDVVFDAFVKPEEPVTDYRTKWSGVREADLKEAIPFKEARKQVKKLIRSSILVGHSMQCDLHALNLFHPQHLLRDTARYHPIRSLAGLSVNNTPSLKHLSSILLNTTIQDSEHCSIEDARAALSLYKLCEKQWEKELTGELTTHSFLSDLYWPSWTRNENSS